MGADKRRIGMTTILAATAGLALAGPMTASALDMQLQIPGISGDKTPIPVLSWSWGASNPIAPLGSGAGAGKINVADASFTHQFDASSSAILQTLLTGKHVPQVTLSVYSGSNGTLPRILLFRVLLDEVFFTSMTNGMSVDDQRPNEQISMAFSKITVKEIRNRSETTTACFDVAANASCL